MIKKAADLKKMRATGMRGGNGTVDMTHFLEEAESFGTGRLFAIATMPPGSSIGKHMHEGNFEIYYILKGAAHVMDNDEPGILEAGDVMVCEDGDTHSIENRGDEDLVALFLVIYTDRKDA